MPSAWGHTRLLETDWRLITQESHCFSCGSVNMREAIGELPEDLQEVIILRYFGDLTVKDTAQELNIPQGTVATRTRKALEMLKEKLIFWEGGAEHESV